MNTIYIAANGCGVLRHEANRILTYFTINSYTEVSSPMEADIIVFVACGMTNDDVSLGLNYIDKLLNIRKAGALLIVAGCLPAVKDDLAKTASNTFVYTYDELKELDRLIDSKIMFSDVTYNAGLSEHLAWPRPQKTKELIEDCELAKKVNRITNNSSFELAYKYSTKGEYIWLEDDIFQIRSAYGCPYACSYCSSRISLGSYRSEPISKIVDQYKIGLSKGYKRFMLIGTELGNYGKDLETNIVELITEMYQIDNTVKLGIRYIHPDCLVHHFEALMPFIESGFLYYLCAAFQTASPSLLKSMNRNPNLNNFIKCIQTIRRKQAPLIMHSQIMVGFPGETLKDLFDTLMILDKCQFDYVNINKFSPRSMTPAARMPEQISEDEKEFRYILANEWMSKFRKELLFNSLSKIIINHNECLH